MYSGSWAWGVLARNVRGKLGQRLGWRFIILIFVRADPDEEEEPGATYHETLDDLLKVADCVTLHTPLNKGTQDLIDARSLSLMKPGGRLVNTARTGS